jgi:diguanylate cyclase (GGDEF)-like protein
MDAEEKRHLIWVAIVSIFILIVILISSYALYRIKEQTNNNIRESLQTVLQTTREAHHLWINYRLRDVLELAQDKTLIRTTRVLLSKGTPKTKSGELAKLRRYITPKLDKNNDEGFFIISPDRISIASMRDSNLGRINLIETKRKNYLDSAFKGATVFVPTIQSDVALSPGLSDRNKKVPTLFIVSPIKNRLGKIIAVLAIRINPSNHFSRISKLGRLGDTGETYAFDENGLLITESRFDHHLRKAGLIPPGDTGILSIRIIDPGGNLLEGYTPKSPANELPLTVMAKSATLGNSGSNIEGYRDYRGVPVFGAWIWEKRLGFGLATEIDINEALRPYYQTRNTIITVVTLIAILSFLFVFISVWLQRKSRRKLQEAYSELENRIERRTKALKKTTENLDKANKELELLAVTDGLTGLYNRRRFDSQLEENIRICRRENRSLSVIMIDIDYFKLFNDNYGHQKGDECLIKVAQSLASAGIDTRPGDIIARYGGEEFVVLLFDANEQYVSKVAEILLDQIHKLQIPHPQAPNSIDGMVSISIGVYTEKNVAKSSPEEIVNKADEALYKAKAKGRNCICNYSQLVSIG